MAWIRQSCVDLGGHCLIRRHYSLRFEESLVSGCSNAWDTAHLLIHLSKIWWPKLHSSCKIFILIHLNRWIFHYRGGLHLRSLGIPSYALHEAAHGLSCALIFFSETCLLEKIVNPRGIGWCATWCLILCFPRRTHGLWYGDSMVVFRFHWGWYLDEACKWVGRIYCKKVSCLIWWYLREANTCLSMRWSSKSTPFINPIFQKGFSRFFAIFCYYYYDLTVLSVLVLGWLILNVNHRPSTSTSTYSRAGFLLLSHLLLQVKRFWKEARSGDGKASG